MVIANDLIAFPNELLGDMGDKDPYMPDGLQVTGVGASSRLFAEAVAGGADANDLVPFWTNRADDSTQEALAIERRIPVFHLRREIGRVEQLERSLMASRSVIGQPRQQWLLELVVARRSHEETQEFAESAMIDLRPPQS